MKSAEELAKGPLPFPGGSPVSLPRWSGVKVHPAPRPPEALSLDDAVANGEEYLIIRSPGVLAPPCTPSPKQRSKTSWHTVKSFLQPVMPARAGRFDHGTSGAVHVDANDSARPPHSPEGEREGAAVSRAAETPGRLRWSPPWSFRGGATPGSRSGAGDSPPEGNSEEAGTPLSPGAHSARDSLLESVRSGPGASPGAPSPARRGGVGGIASLVGREVFRAGAQLLGARGTQAGAGAAQQEQQRRAGNVDAKLAGEQAGIGSSLRQLQQLFARSRSAGGSSSAGLSLHGESLHDPSGRSAHFSYGGSLHGTQRSRDSSMHESQADASQRREGSVGGLDTSWLDGMAARAHTHQGRVAHVGGDPAPAARSTPAG